MTGPDGILGKGSLTCEKGSYFLGSRRRRGGLCLSDGSCVRLRPERANHVKSCDFVQDRTHVGRTFRTLNVIDESTKEALMIRVDRN